MPLYSAIICRWKKNKNAWRLILQRRQDAHTDSTHKVNDMMPLETNYKHIIFKYFISSKSTGILLLYTEDTQEDVIAVLTEMIVPFFILQYFCIYVVKTGKSG